MQGLLIIIDTLPPIVTVTQAYEWETVVLVIQEQKDDTKEETFAKMNKPSVKKLFEAKEGVQRRMYYIAVVVMVIFNIIA